VDKPLKWVGSSRDDLRRFPDDARVVAGFQLRRVQGGLEPNDWKPMPSVGPGVREIRIHTGLEHRVLYVARLAEGVYVLHAFEKRSRKTAKTDLDLARHRLAVVIAEHTAAGR
jgi:phage-related protein